MSDSPTPETDSVTRSADETPWTPWVCAGHAKRLERERDEARRNLVGAEELHRRRFGTLKAECEAVRDRLADSERDRDDAWKGWTDAINGWNKDIEKLEGAISERDEARRERDDAIEELSRVRKELVDYKRWAETNAKVNVLRELNVLIAKLKEEA